jgi:hypothetical protein
MGPQTPFAPTADQLAYQQAEAQESRGYAISSGIQAGSDLLNVTGQLIGVGIQGKQQQNLMNLQTRHGKEMAKAQGLLAEKQAVLVSAQAKLAAAARSTNWVMVAGIASVLGLGLGFIWLKKNQQ